MEDKWLVWKFNRGDSRALSRIYEKYRNDLLRLAVSVLAGSADAEDVVQEVFINFARQAGKFRLTGSLKSYLVRCVINCARNQMLAGKRRELRETKTIDLSDKSVKTPDQLIMNRQQVELLSSMMASLPQNQRDVISLRLYGGMKFREIARFEECSLKTVQSRYRLGLEKLKSSLDKGDEK